MSDETGVVVPIRGRVIPPQPDTPPPKPETARDDARPLDVPSGQKARERMLYRQDRDRRIMQMFISGATPAAIAAAFSARGEPISASGVKRIISREQQAAAADRREMASLALDIELTRLDGLIRRAHAILDEPCSVCRGTGQTATGGACRDCRGDGRSAHPDTRLRAMREIRSLVESKSRLLGLDVTHVEVTGKDGDPIRMEVSQMTDDELSRSIEDFTAGAAAARALADAPAVD